MQGDVRKPESLAKGEPVQLDDFHRAALMVDAGCDAAVAGAVAKFGRIDHVLCAAAGNFLSPIDGMSENGEYPMLTALNLSDCCAD